jgi:hypothetical protein
MLELLGRIFALDNPLWYYWPLIVLVGIVYKATQYDNPRQIARNVAHFVASVTAFMLLLAVLVFAMSEWL